MEFGRLVGVLLGVSLELRHESSVHALLLLLALLCLLAAAPAGLRRRVRVAVGGVRYHRGQAG